MLFIHSSVEGHLGCFYFSAIMNNAAIISLYKCLCGYKFFNSLG